MNSPTVILCRYCLTVVSEPNEVCATCIANPPVCCVCSSPATQTCPTCDAPVPLCDSCEHTRSVIGHPAHVAPVGMDLHCKASGQRYIARDTHIHASHLRAALYFLSTDPAEGSPLYTQLEAVTAAMGLDIADYLTPRASFERGYAYGMLGTSLASSEPNDPWFLKGHALGRKSRNVAIPPAPEYLDYSSDSVTIDSPMTESYRRLRAPVTYGHGSNTIRIGVNCPVTVVRKIERHECIFTLCRFGGMYMLLGEEDVRLEPYGALTRDVDRWDLFREIFEGADPGVWGDDAALTEMVRKDVDTVNDRDVRTARTRYRNGELGEAKDWVVERIDRMKEWKKAKGETWQERFGNLAAGTREKCKKPE